MTSHKVFKSANIYVPESEVESYSILPNKIIGVPSDIKGITQTRNWILKNCNCNVFFIDDDLQYGGYVQRTETSYKVKRITEELIYIEEMVKLFEVCNQMNSKICGFFTVGNNLTN